MKKTKKYLLILGCLMTISVVLIATNSFGLSKLFVANSTILISKAQANPDDPWLNGYLYRMPIVVTNLSGSPLTDYQVLATVNTQNLIGASKMQSDCDDIRFTTSDGVTAQNYWIQSGCNSATTKIWVKASSLTAGAATTTIYMYYGNSSVSAGSSGANTFVFFDDFSGSLSKWLDRSNGSGSSAIVSGQLKLSCTTSYGWGAVASSATIANNQAYVYEAKMQGETNNWHSGLMGFADLNTDTSGTVSETVFWNNWVGFGGVKGSTTGVVRGYAATADSTGNTANISQTITTQALYKTIWAGLNSASFYIDDVSKGSMSTKVPATSTTMYVVMYMLNDGAYGNKYYLFDDVRVRKYANPEPTAANGSEDSLVTQMGSATSWTWALPTLGQAVPNGSATDWSWTTFQAGGANLTVPRGSAADWSWGP